MESKEALHDLGRWSPYLMSGYQFLLGDNDHVELFLFYFPDEDEVEFGLSARAVGSQEVFAELSLVHHTTPTVEAALLWFEHHWEQMQLVASTLKVLQ